jgi:hypothetical protein
MGPRLPLQQETHGSSVQPAIALCPRGPHRRSLGSVQHPELNAGQVGGPTHDSTERVHFAHYCALRNPADGGVARHLADGFQVLGQQEGSRASAGCECSGFRTSVTATDYDDIVLFHGD